MNRVFVFPGQGSQAVGMGLTLAAAFAEARAVFEEVDDALGQKLTKLMFEGPADDLKLTENAQPALMAVSMAVIRVLEKQGEYFATIPDTVGEDGLFASHITAEPETVELCRSIDLSDLPAERIWGELEKLLLRARRSSGRPRSRRRTMRRIW